MLIPLEFETEWESDVGSVDGDEGSAFSQRRRHFGGSRLKRSLAFPPNMIEPIDPASAQLFSTLLTPAEGDDVVARTINAVLPPKRKLPEKKKRELASILPSADQGRKLSARTLLKLKLKAARGCDGDQSDGEDDADGESDQEEYGVGDITVKAGCKVATPFGRGTVISATSAYPDIVEVSEMG